MRAGISIPLAALFFLAAFNVWIMLTGRGPTPRSRKIWTQIHRICGYAFIALFVIFCYFMLVRIRSADDRSPTIVLRFSLALILAPLLLVKVIVARRQKSAWNILITLGVTIFAVAFTLVAMNVAVHYLRALVSHKTPFAPSMTVIGAVIILSLIPFFAKSRQPKRKPVSATRAPADSVSRQESPREEVLGLTLARIESQTPDAKTFRFILPANWQIASRRDSS